MNEWLWTYDDYLAGEEGQREALCTVGNGYVATRGALAECGADGVHYPGTYIAGVYNRLTTDVAGHDVVNECLVNVPNWLPVLLRVHGGEWFSVDRDEVLEHRLELDLERAVLRRRTRLRDRDGRTLSISERRLVSLADQHLLASETTFVAEDFSGPVEIASVLDGTVRNTGVPRYRSLESDHLEHVDSRAAGADTMVLEVRTNDSGIGIAQAARTTLRVAGGGVPDHTSTPETGHRYAARLFSLELEQGAALAVEKVVALFTSRDHGMYSAGDAAVHGARRAAGFEGLLDRHTTSWAHAWKRSRMSLSGDVGHTARIVNLHIYHLLTTVSKHTTDLDAGVPARGLHGEAYRGHIFWDELFIFPYLTLRVPELTKALIRYRSRRLERAREDADEAGYEGAMYPWQSGSDGREETQTLHLNPESGRWLPDASHLQRHINAAVVVNVWRYWQATNDLEFMGFWGAEMMIEIARFWASISTHDEATDRYEIKGVMGPDEFHEGYPDREEPGLDNNAYTNVMAVWCLCRTIEALGILPGGRRAELVEKLRLSDAELDRWNDISHKMRLCFHRDGSHGDEMLSQFEGYGDLLELDWDAYRERYGDIGRLDRILEAEGDSPNRYKLAKQADTVMLFYVLSSHEIAQVWGRLGYEWDRDLIRRNIEYYEARTSHGSTLSMMVHAWLHSRLDRRRSWEMFRFALASDINDIQGGTTREGIHLGAMAGTVDMIQRCYGGIDTRGDVLHVNPRLPEELHELAFTINYRRQAVSFEVDQERIRIELSADSGHSAPIALNIAGRPRVLEPGGTLELRLD